MSNIAIESEGVEFYSGDHSYRLPDGRRVMSVTQILKLGGVISYAGIPSAILAHAAWRGTLVHEATAMMDRDNLDFAALEYDFTIPDEIAPYLRAWADFKREFEFIPDQGEIERARVVTVRGIEYAMTPDAIGTMRGIPTVIEKKCTVTVHPCWGIQLAGYEAGAKRPTSYRNHQRVAVQLKPDATFKPHPFEDPSDFDMFLHLHSVAAWKLNHRIAKIDD